MTKVVFGEYAAFDSGKGIRFQQNNQLVSEKAVPAEVVSYLKAQITIEPTNPPQTVGLAVPSPEPNVPQSEARFPRPTEEQLKQMREDSLKPAPGLELTPEEIAARAVNPPPSPDAPIEQPPLNDEDFVIDLPPIDDPNTPTRPTEPPFTKLETDEVSSPVRPIIAESAVDPDFMERTSIYTADIKDIALALYDRFGIYTVYLNQVPQTDEVNPLTGEAFTRYHQGIAYQALIRVRGSGFFNRPAELGMERVTEGRIAHENYQRDVGDARPDQTAPTTDTSSFAYRTSPASGNPTQTHYIAHEEDPVTHEIRAVRREIPQAAQHSGKVNNSTQRYDANSEEMIVEPTFGQQVIRPNW